MTDTGATGTPTPTTGPTEVDFVALQAGQTIGRYEILSILGQGGFGITYRARDAQLSRDVAIKEYLPSALAVRQDGITVLPRSTKMADDFTWGRERFVAEGRTLATLQRAPAIVRVFDFLEANGTAYIVMELAPGETLEARLRRQGTLGRAAVERVLWPLLDGLEQVHGAGFLHRDIKPANILLDDDGNPTLIDFGASRAAMAGRTVAMTAIFTPGYAAAEQFTSAKQGPWTDIYGVSATLYHAITGASPPSAFDRMLDDGLRTLSELRPDGFPPPMLAGLDAGLIVRANERPQSIALWRPMLEPTGSGATVVLPRPAAAATAEATQVLRTPPPPSAPSEPPAVAARRAPKPLGLGLAVAAVLLLLAGGGGYWYATRPAPPDPAAIAAEAEAAKQKAREQAEREAAQRKEIEDETRRKVEAEMAAKQKAELEERRRHVAEEQALRLTLADRQRVQVALAALGFPTGATDGAFNTRTREQITAWQKARGEAATGFLTGAQNQALLRDAAPAVGRFDDEKKAEEQKKVDEQKKLDDLRKADEARRRAEDEKARSAAVAPPPAAPPVAPPVAPLSPAPPAAGTTTGADGHWRGTYHCTPSQAAGEMTIHLNIDVVNGTGMWQLRPNAQSIALRVNGDRVFFTRNFHPFNQQDRWATASIAGRWNGRTITASGPEANSGGRTCEINLTKM